MRVKTFVTAAAFAAITLPLFAEATMPRAGETIDVSIVNLDVIVTDKHGHRIHGLTKDDFEVFEDGKPQAITNFAAYAPEASIVGSKAGVEASAATPKRQRRTIAIFIENFRLAPFRTEPIFASLKKTLRDVIAPGDAVLIATWNMRTVTRLDYTDDLGAIDQTLDRIEKESTGAILDPVTDYRQQIEQLREWFGEAESAASSAGLPVSEGGGDWFVDMEAQSAAEMALVHMREKTAAINAFISTMANEDGRKAMILVTRRFSHIAGGEYFFVGGRSGLQGMNERARYATYDLRDKIKANANAHNVTIYAFYPPGLDWTNASSPFLRNAPAVGSGAVDHQVLLNELNALSDITDATGGTYAWGSVNIVDQMPAVRDDFEDYYSLAYRVGARNDNRVRDVVVKTKNRGYVVRTRKEYMEKNDDGRVRDQVVAALFRPPASSGITVTTTLGKAVAKDKHHFTIPVTVRMPANAFLTSQEGDASKGAFTVYVATGRVVGETSDVSKQTIPFTIADAKQAKDGYFTYDFELLTDAATNRLAVGVYDEVSHDTGFARADLYDLSSRTGVAR